MAIFCYYIFMSIETPKDEPNPFAPRTEGEYRAYIRSREEVEQMNADYESEQRRLRLAQRLGGVATPDQKPEDR